MNLKTCLRNLIKNNKELVKQKGYYQYEYVNSVERFNETKSPYSEDFYTTLNDKNISDKDNIISAKNFGQKNFWTKKVSENINVRNFL